MYDPTVGRFLTEDPSGLDVDSNPYRYVGNTPTMYIDPTGLISSRGGLISGFWQITYGLGHGLSLNEMGVANEIKGSCQRFATEYGHGDEYKDNGARHAIWMFRLTLYFGSPIAKKIGDAHEASLGNLPWDTWIDQYNNGKARDLADSMSPTGRRRGVHQDGT
jgi:uncharacterized protein RhaS with RHS repeats